MNFYETILIGFEQEDVRYLIVGGVAATLYGVDRSTKELDIWIEIKEENLFRIRECFIRQGYHLNNIEEAIEHLKRGEVITLPDEINNLPGIDLMGSFSSYLSFEEAFQSWSVLQLDEIHCHVLSIDLLIDVKLKTSRDKDLYDVKKFQEIKKMGRDKFPG